MIPQFNSPVNGFHSSLYWGFMNRKRFFPIDIFVSYGFQIFSFGWKTISLDLCYLQCTQGFLTTDSFHSTSLATWGSKWGSKEVKFIKEFDFLGFSRCFSARIEQSSKIFKIQSNCVSREAKFIKEFDFLGFSRCFSARIE